MYQLVFKGECVPGVELATARANVAQVFKATDAQLDRMFSGQRVVIRNRLEEAAAVKFQAALARQGIRVYVESMAPGPDSPAPASARAGQSSPPTAGPSAQAAGPAGQEEPAAAPGAGRVEPGDRLPLAGDQVDQILAGSSLTLGKPGETLGEPGAVETPVFREIEDWTLAPPGERLGELASVPVAVPEAPDLEVLPPGKY